MESKSKERTGCYHRFLKILNYAGCLSMVIILALAFVSLYFVSDVLRRIHVKVPGTEEIYLDEVGNYMIAHHRWRTDVRDLNLVIWEKESDSVVATTGRSILAGSKVRRTVGFYQEQFQVQRPGIYIFVTGFANIDRDRETMLSVYRHTWWKELLLLGGIYIYFLVFMGVTSFTMIVMALRFWRSTINKLRKFGIIAPERL